MWMLLIRGDFNRSQIALKEILNPTKQLLLSSELILLFSESTV